MYFGGQVPGGFKPKRMGAMHEARFMAGAVYLISIEVFPMIINLFQCLYTRINPKEKYFLI